MVPLAVCLAMCLPVALTMRGPSYPVAQNPNPTMNTATNLGMNPGMNPGMNQGMNTGMNPGMNQGMNVGMNQGMNVGMNQGMNPGMNQGMNPGYQGYRQPNYGWNYNRYAQPSYNSWNQWSRPQQHHQQQHHQQQQQQQQQQNDPLSTMWLMETLGGPQDYLAFRRFGAAGLHMDIPDFMMFPGMFPGMNFNSNPFSRGWGSQQQQTQNGLSSFGNLFNNPAFMLNSNLWG